MSIEDMARQIQSKGDFDEFLELLIMDVQSEEFQQWENKTIEDFLNGLKGFTHDIAGYYRNLGEEFDPNLPNWRTVADLLLAARVYE